MEYPIFVTKRFGGECRNRLGGDADGINHIPLLVLGLLSKVPLRFPFSNVDHLVRAAVSNQLLETVDCRVVNRDGLEELCDGDN